MPSKRGEPASPASLANLDRDGNGDPGGSLPKKVPLVDLATGAIVVAGVQVRDLRLADGSARLATARDLRIGGRADLVPLLRPLADGSPQ